MKVVILFIYFIFSHLMFAAEFKDSLTKKELEWLHNHPTIKYSGNPNHLPYEAFDDYGNHIGMVADYLDIIKKKLNIEIQRVPSQPWPDAVKKNKNTQVDILSNYTNNKDFLNTYIMTHGFIKSPIVLIVKRRGKIHQ